MQKLQEWHDVDQEVFQKDIITSDKPAVLKSLVADWPAVQQARKSPLSVSAYISQFDVGNSLQVLVGSQEQFSIARCECGIG